MKKKLIEMPEELFKKIEASAKKNVRSVNKEIQFLLASAVGKKYINCDCENIDIEKVVSSIVVVYKCKKCGGCL